MNRELIKDTGETRQLTTLGCVRFRQIRLMQFRNIILFVVRIAAIGIILNPFFPRNVDAQAVPGGGWSEAINLSNSSGASSMPEIVTDPYGLVHVFWSEDLDGNTPDSLSLEVAVGNAIIYQYLKNGNWSYPIDLFYGGANGRLESPEAVVDRDGNLRLIWIQNGALTYSWASVERAGNVRAWSVPQVLVEGGVHRARLLDLGDKLIVIYSLMLNQTSGLYAIVFDSQSMSFPALIWSGSATTGAHDIGASIDGSGRVHVVWSVVRRPSPAAVEVQYSKSEDHGTTWKMNRTIARQTSNNDSLQFAVPWVAARGNDEVHLQWAQGDQAYRRHTYSTDGGDTWGEPYQIWPELASQTNSQATAIDEDGNLYWADVLRYPNGAYLIRWDDRLWDIPEMFFVIDDTNNGTSPNRVNAHALRMAISQGNELYVIFQDQDKGEIWIMHKTLPARQSALLPLPTPIPTATPLTAPILDTGDQPTPMPIQVSPENETAGVSLHLESRQGWLILAGLAPSLIILLAMIVRNVKKG
jgi:hypothetical protein